MAVVFDRVSHLSLQLHCFKLGLILSSFICVIVILIVSRISVRGLNNYLDRSRMTTFGCQAFSIIVLMTIFGVTECLVFITDVKRVYFFVVDQRGVN